MSDPLSDQPGDAGRPARERIVASALHILARDGYAKLTARAIAAEAGTNLALVNYYFGSKQNLLLALFDALETSKYGRQQMLHTDPDRPLSAKWREAVAYYREDLADGYVRMQLEFHALAWSNPALAERLLRHANRWRDLLAEAASALPSLGVELPPRLVAVAVDTFWLGMESFHLAGDPEEHNHFFAILDAVGDWLEARERAVAGAAGAGEPDTGPDGARDDGEASPNGQEG